MWECIGSSRATAVCRNFRSVTDAITIGVSVRRVRSSVGGVVVESCVSFHIVEQTIAVHIRVKCVTDAVAIEVVWHVCGVEWVRKAFHFQCVEVPVIVVIIVSNQAARAVRVDVGISVAVGVDW